MPLPSPNEGENQREFIARCMGNDTSKQDYPDNDQRLAICFQQWRRRNMRGELMPWNNIAGLWAIQPEWLSLHADQIQRLATPNEANLQQPEGRSLIDEMITIRGDMAVIPLHGPMIKHASFWALFFGFASTKLTEQAIIQAASNEDIKAIMLHIESPGGHVAGVHELAETVRRVGQKKAIFAHIDDLGASAAYWVASQAGRVTANQTAEVGSLGVLAMITDTSKLADRMGIKVHVLSTGKFKGAGAPGTPVEDEHLEHWQARVDAINSFFMGAVKRGRAMSAEQMNAVNDGRVFGAAESRDLQLVDDVRSFDAALIDASRMLSAGSRNDRARRRIAEGRQLTIEAIGETALMREPEA